MPRLVQNVSLDLIPNIVKVGHQKVRTSYLLLMKKRSLKQRGRKKEAVFKRKFKIP